MNMTVMNVTSNATNVSDSQSKMVVEDFSLLFSIVTGIACTVLIFTAFMPFAERWDKYITRKFARNTIYVVQHLDDNASSIFSNVVFSSSSNGEVEDCSKESKPQEISSRPDIEGGIKYMDRTDNKREEGNEVSIVVKSNESF